MARIGFIGLGNIGAVLARHLVDDGHDLWVHDALPERASELARAGAHAALGAGEVARQSEVTLLSLPTPEAVDGVAADWLASAPAGSLLADLSTNAPERVRALASRVRDGGCELVDAPLTGGAVGARNRALVFMVGGPEKSFQRIEPILAPLSRATLHMGELGAGMTSKLVNSCIAFTTACASLEALALGAKSGLDLRSLVELVRLAGAGNYYVDGAVEGIERRGAPTDFALALAAKDAGLILELARQQGVPTPLAAGAAQTLVSAVGAGLGDSDWTELPAVIERMGDLAFALAPASK